MRRRSMKKIILTALLCLGFAVPALDRNERFADF